MDFYFAQFGDEANFGGACIAGSLNLCDAQFSHSLLFDHKGAIVQFSDKNGLAYVSLRGCTYGRLVLPNEYAGLQDYLADRAGSYVTVIIGVIIVICVVAFRRGFVGELLAWIRARAKSPS